MPTSTVAPSHLDVTEDTIHSHGIQLRTGRRFDIVVQRSLDDLLLRFLTGAVPPWRDAAAPEARLLDAYGQVVARQTIEGQDGRFAVRFQQVPAGLPLRLDFDGQSEDARIVSQGPLDSQAALAETPAPEPPAPSLESQGRVFKYHDARKDRKLSENRSELLAHARQLGGFYLLDSVGRGGKNRPAYDDVQRVQERLWALGFLEAEFVGAAIEDRDADPTVRAIRALQSRLGSKKPDGVIAPDKGTHKRMMGRQPYDGHFIFTPDEPLEPENLLEPDQNPAWTDQGSYPRDHLGDEVPIIVKDTPLWHMVRAFDPNKISRRHYDIVTPLDGLTFGIAHWPLGDGYQIMSALFAEEEPRAAFLMRFKEFFEVDDNEALWQIFVRDAERGTIDLEVGGLDLDASLPDDGDLDAQIERCLARTLLNEAWWRGSKTSKGVGRRVFDLLWFRKSFGYALRDRRIVEFQVRFWIKDRIHIAQTKCLEKLGIETLGGIAAATSMFNSRKAWIDGLPTSGNSFVFEKWQQKRAIVARYDKDTGELEISKGPRSVRFAWHRQPSQDWRSYAVWQYYWTMRDFWDDKPDLRARNAAIWNIWFAKAFSRSFEDNFKTSSEHHSLTSLQSAAHSGTALEKGTLLPRGFDPKKRESWQLMRSLVPCYARLAQTGA